MELVNKGKKMLIAVIVVCLTLSVLVTALTAALYNTNGDTSQATYQLTQGLFRFVLECLLFLFVFKGHRWARITAIILFGIGGIFAFFAMFVTNYLMLIIAVPYITSLIILLSEPVKIFQKYKKHGTIDDDLQS